MASDATATLANAALDAMFKDITRYVGLSTDGANEITGNAYARVSRVMDTAAASATTNAAVCQFAAASGNWGTVTHAAWFDAATAGNRLTAWKTLAGGSVTVNLGDVVEFAIGALDITA